MSIAELIADTYRDASLAGAKMPEVARAMESLREEWPKPSPTADSRYLALGWLDARVAATNHSGLISVLTELRRRLSAWMLEADLVNIHHAFGSSADEGWLTWRRAFGVALSYSRWLHCVALAAESPRCSSQVPREVALIAPVAPLLAHERFADCYELFREVVRWEGIQPWHRASVAISAAQIQMYHLWDLECAKLHIEEARQLGGENARLDAAQGELHLQFGKLELAKACFEQAIAREPSSSVGHIGMGDVLLSARDPDPEAAEDSYRRATRCSDGCTSAYLRLLRLYERPKWFANNEATIVDLYGRALRGDPDFPVSPLVTLSDVYAANAAQEKQLSASERVESGALRRYQELREKALRCYDDADARDHERPDGLLAKGRFLAKEGEVDAARKCFEQAQCRSGGRVPAAWEFVMLERAAGRWSDLPGWIDRIIAERPGSRRLLLPILGEARFHQGDFDGAERILVEALHLDAEGSAAESELQELSYKYATERKDLTAAIHVLDEIKNIRGAPYEATYHNRVGVLQFEQGHYKEAVESFRRAVSAKPEESVMRSNLALACEQVWNEELSALHWADEALAALREARRLDPKNLSYVDRLANLERCRRLAALYGHTAMKRLPAVTAVAIEAPANLRPLLLEDEDKLNRQFERHIMDMRAGLYGLLGFAVPSVRVRINESDLPSGTYVILIREIPLASGNIVLTRGLCNATVDRLALLKVKSEEAVNPANGSECAWIDQNDWQKVKDAGFDVWTPAEYIVLHLASVIRKNPAEVVGIQATADLLKDKGNELYARIHSAQGSLSRFTSVIQALLCEEVPVKELSSICDWYLDSLSLPTYDIPEEIRRQEAIRKDIPANTCDTPLYYLGENLVALIAEGVHRDGEAAVLALEPEPTQEALTVVRNKVSNLPPTYRNPALFVEDWRIRTFVRKLVELEFPYLTVLSRREAMAPDSMPVLDTIEVQSQKHPGKR